MTAKVEQLPNLIMGFRIARMERSIKLQYIGPSMIPTLRRGDLLEVISYEKRLPNRGDVIVFKTPVENKLVTHRIISINKEGLRTKGDNNWYMDTLVITPQQIIGKVTHAKRGSKQLKILGGLRGYVYAWMKDEVRQINIRINHLLSPIYHWLAKKGFFRHCFTSLLKLRVLAYKRSNGTEIQLLFGYKVIGRLLPQAKTWWIRRPFRLFVDETSLPKNNP
jgi:signal peptidase I